ncbi:unnamed protein product, partial [Amoebophrya sp. A25]
STSSSSSAAQDDNVIAHQDRDHADDFDPHGEDLFNNSGSCEESKKSLRCSTMT